MPLGFFVLSPGSPFAGKVRLFIWRSANIKYTTRAATQDAASARSRQHAEQELGETACSGWWCPKPMAHSPGIAWANPPPSCFASFEICRFRPCVACEDSTAEDQLVPAEADANQPLPLLSKAFLFITAWPSRGYGFAALSSSRCVLSLLPEFLVAPPKSPSCSSFLLLFCAPPPGSLNCLWIKLQGERQVLSTTDMVSL